MVPEVICPEFVDAVDLPAVAQFVFDQQGSAVVKYADGQWDWGQVDIYFGLNLINVLLSWSS